MRAVQPAISTGGSSSSTMRRASVGELASPPGSRGARARRAGRRRRRSTPRARSGSAPTSGAPVSAASASPPPLAEDRVARAVGRDELAHVLDHAEHLEVRAAGHVGDARRDLLRALRGRGDDEHLGLRQQAGQRHLDVAGAGRHVDEQVVEVAPAHVDEELLERLGEDQAAPHERGVLVVDEQAHRHDLERPAVAPTSTLERRSDLALAVGLPSSRRGGLHAEHARDVKPQMSASSTPT